MMLACLCRPVTDSVQKQCAKKIIGLFDALNLSYFCSKKKVKIILIKTFMSHENNSVVLNSVHKN